MAFFCPKCYAETMISVRIEEDGKQLRCTRNSNHVFYLDKEGFPRSIKQ